ncbi:MAG TPA: GNAT family acetyltransferase [Elainellaceae cyanobacterium]
MLTDVLIRPYHLADQKAVIDLWKTCNLTVPWNDPKQDIERKCQVNPEWFLVGDNQGDVIATCMVGYEGHRGWINYLAVSPDYRGCGIATQLMNEAERLLRAAGCPKINLQIRATNTEVIEFYRRLGFTHDPVVSMGKHLVD